MIDLRSDTVTQPTEAMRRAMARAEVGDDVFGEDPTVNALEERAAGLLGKEAGLFVASGTMGNLVAILGQVARGHELITGRRSHIVLDEAAGYAAVAGASVRVLDERPDGTISLRHLRQAFRDPADIHEPPTALVVLENTHALSMGRALTPEYTRSVAEVARMHGLPLHIDGARFWNAVVAQRPNGVRAVDLAEPADTVTFCLSKGLACPAGSVLVGSKAAIGRARRARKLLGGGMRQAGVLAAAGLVALADGDQGMVDRLEEDHGHARRLAEGIAEIRGVVSAGGIAQAGSGPLDPSRVTTNFLLFRVAMDRTQFLARLGSNGVQMSEFPSGQVRAVTHYGITSRMVERAILAVRQALEGGN